MSTTTTFPEFFAEAASQGLAAWKGAQELSLRTAESATGLLRSGAAEVPSAAQALEAGFQIAAKALEQQHNYIVRLAEIWTQSPSTEG
jgi:hypothetical protein